MSTLDLVELALTATAAAFVLWVCVIEPHRLQLVHIDVPVRDLPQALEGYTIGVLSDLHHLPTIDAPKVARAVSTINDAAPDLVVLLGDYGASFKTWPRLTEWLYARMLARVGPILATLHARDGVLSVLGNHDHYYGCDRVTAWLSSLGTTVLSNDSRCIMHDGATLVVGGVDDAWEGNVDPHGGCAHAPADATTIVLAHHPDSVMLLSTERRVDLVLSGHTHGGQIVIPWYGAPVTHSRVCTRHHPSGWVPNARAALYVSRGVGEQTPIRFNCRPEVTVMTLRRSVSPAQQPT
jgi:predicted MPP superfamily phosphohydrolase